MVLPYSRVVLLSFGIVPWCMWHLHLLCPYCTTTPAQLIVICLVLLLPLCHVGSIWWSCLRYMWILCPLAPSHGICGMSTSADLCIPCHILIVLWIIMAVVLWTRVVYISYGTFSWCPLHFCHTCSFNPITLSAFGRIKWFLPYSRVVLLSFGIVPWCMWHRHLLCPYCTTTPALCVLCNTTPRWLLYILVDIIYVLICILPWFIH